MNNITVSCQGKALQMFALRVLLVKYKEGQKPGKRHDVRAH